MSDSHLRTNRAHWGAIAKDYAAAFDWRGTLSCLKGRKISEKEMTVKMSSLLVAFIVVVASMPASITQAETSQAADKAEVSAAFRNLTEAYNRGDTAAAMTFYADDGVFFEDTIPLQFNKTMLRKSSEGFYKSISGYHASARSVEMQVSGHLAVLHCVVHEGWTAKTGPYSQTSRLTEVYVKQSGKWLIWNEHFSVPFDPATGKAVLNANP